MSPDRTWWECGWENATIVSLVPQLTQTYSLVWSQVGPGETLWETGQPGPGPKGAETLSGDAFSFLRTAPWYRRKKFSELKPSWQSDTLTKDGGKKTSYGGGEWNHAHTHTKLSLLRDNLVSRLTFSPHSKLCFLFSENSEDNILFFLWVLWFGQSAP